MDVIKVFLDMNLRIQKEFGPLNWIDVTAWTDDYKGSISFTDDGESADEFFSKMRGIKDFIKGFGYSASLTKYEADKLCPYNEARIDIDFTGGELDV
jgi:hypothetical protein